VFSTPLGLLALLGLPAIVGLHLFRRRFQPRTTSALFLWGVEDKNPASGRKRQPLHRSKSLWLELLAALLLALFLAGFDPFGERRAEHFVAVLDGSNSMLASGRTADGGEASSAADAARDLVAERLDALGGADRVTLIESGSPPRLLCGPAASKAEARSALANYAPARIQDGRAASLALALEVTGGEGRVLWVGDTFLEDELPPEVEVVAVGEAQANWALTQVRRRRVDPETDRISFTVASFAGLPRELRAVVRAEADPEPLVERAFDLEPEGRETLSLELPASAPTLRLELTPDDHPVDDTAWLAPLPPRELRLFSELTGDQAWRLGLADPRDERPERWLELIGEARFVEQVDSADLVLSWGSADADGSNAASGGRGLGSRLHLRPPQGEGQTWIGPFLVERAHPLLEGVSLDGVAWHGDPARQVTGVTLAAAGPASLISERMSRGRRGFELHIDPERSTLWRTPDWPILLSNWARLVRSELPGPQRTTLAAGEGLTWIADGSAELRVLGPNVDQTFLADRSLTLDAFDRPGLYTVEVDGRERFEVAVNGLDEGESDLRARGGGRRPSQNASATATASRGPWTLALLALTLLAWVFDAWALRRDAQPAGGQA
jgi:hypothetical protein